MDFDDKAFQLLISLVTNWKDADVVRSLLSSPHMRFSIVLEIMHLLPDKTSAFQTISRNRALPLSTVLCHFDEPWDWSGLSATMPLQEIVVTSGNLPWEFASVSMRSDLTGAVIGQIPDAPWDFFWLSMNRLLTVKDVLSMPFAPWSFCNLCSHLDLSGISDLSDFGIFPFQCRFLSRNKSPQVIDLVLRRPDYDWDWVHVSMHIALQPHHVLDHRRLPWNFAMMSRAPVAPRLVSRIPNKPWDYGELSKNKCMQIRTALQHPDKLWDWAALSAASDVTLDIVQAHIHRPWNWELLSKSVPIQQILDNLDYPWRWHYISANPSVRIEHVKNNVFLPWVWPILQRQLSVDDILEHANHLSDFSYLSDRIPLKYILDHQNMTWTWPHIFRRDFTAEFPQLYARWWMAVMVIQHRWRRARRDPAFRTCHKLQVHKLHE